MVVEQNHMEKTTVLCYKARSHWEICVRHEHEAQPFFSRCFSLLSSNTSYLASSSYCLLLHCCLSLCRIFSPLGLFLFVRLLFSSFLYQPSLYPSIPLINPPSTTRLTLLHLSHTHSQLLTPTSHTPYPLLQTTTIPGNKRTAGIIQQKSKC